MTEGTTSVFLKKNYSHRTLSEIPKLFSKSPTFFESSSRSSSFYQGPFSRGAFGVSPVFSPKETSAVPSPKVLTPRSKHINTVTNSTTVTEPAPPKTSRNLFEVTRSYANNKALKIDPEIPHELPYMNQLILRDQPGKLKDFLEMNNPNKFTLEWPRKDKKDDRPPSLKAYLSFLEKAPDDGTTCFSARMHEKIANEEKLAGSLTSRRKSIKIDRKWFEQVFTEESKDLDTLNRLSGVKESSGKTTTEVIASNRRRSSLRLTLESFGAKMSRVSFVRELPAFYSQRKSGSGSRQDGRKDETMARQLADELVMNYRLFLASAARAKELSTKLNTFLKENDVHEVFSGKLNKYLPLQTRIYRDMTEVVEDQFTTMEKQKVSLLLPAHLRPSVMKSGRTQVKIIAAKYNVYKSVNEQLVSLLAQFKLQGLQLLENRLIQSHDEFKKKKNEVLRNLEKWNAKKFNDLKGQCEDVEDMVSYFEGYELHDKIERNNTISKETKTINKSLNTMLANWKKKLNHDYHYPTEV